MSKDQLNHLPIRPRRLRRTSWLRALVAEHHLCVEDLIWPLFVHEGQGLVTSIEGLPGVHRLSIDKAVDAAREAHALGIPAIALFPVTPADLKTEDGCEAFNPENLICRAIRAIKQAVPEIGIIGDVALDPYTTHGHDGLLIKNRPLQGRGRREATGGGDMSAIWTSTSTSTFPLSGGGSDVDNDATVVVLCKQALVLAEAGCDIVAPSDMMDGRVGEIRAALDGKGYHNTIILSYAVKYASALYGPFRAAVGSLPASSSCKGEEAGGGQGSEVTPSQLAPLQRAGYTDKRSYQMNPANSTEALREVVLDLEQGADMVMVKPASLYLDVIARVRELSDVPVLAYHVSGEYAMVKAAASAGILDEKAVMLETLVAIKRAGAAAILTYAARDVAKWLKEK